MIRHIILFKVKHNCPTIAVNQALQNFLSLQKKLIGIEAMMVGECYFHEDNSSEFTHAISIDFLDKKTLENFFNNPITNFAKDGVVRIAEHGYQGVIGFSINGEDQ